MEATIADPVLPRRTKAKAKAKPAPSPQCRAAARVVAQKRPRLASAWRPQSISPDGRSRDGRLIRNVRQGLVRRLGRTPDQLESILIERAAWSALLLSRLDEARAAGEKVDEDRYSRLCLMLIGAVGKLGIQSLDLGVPQIAPPLPSADTIFTEHNMIRLELDLLAAASATQVDFVGGLLVRLDHAAQAERSTPTLEGAQAYYSLVAELNAALNALTPGRLINTTTEKVLRRHAADSAMLLVEAEAVAKARAKADLAADIEAKTKAVSS